MRFYPKADVNYFVDVKPGWNTYCRYPSDKSWATRRKQPKHYINYYLDLEGGRKPYITVKDLYFKKWPKSRLNEKACLPLLYCTGCRFIKLEQGPPAGFTCAPFPMNLAEARNMKKQLHAEQRQAELDKKNKKKKKKEDAKGGSKSKAK